MSGEKRPLPRKRSDRKKLGIEPSRTTARDFFEMIIKVVDQRDAANNLR